ncbi:MAG TPA: hypothetical protein VHA13_05765 [Gammaproteobacteria bacterium]|nr:hypothetical protein [Gammaproteobacteria bacterium]
MPRKEIAEQIKMKLQEKASNESKEDENRPYVLENLKKQYSKLEEEIARFKTKQQTGQKLENYIIESYQRKEAVLKHLQQEIEKLAAPKTNAASNKLKDLTNILHKQEEQYTNVRNSLLAQMGMEKHRFNILIAEDSSLKQSLNKFIITLRNQIYQLNQLKLQQADKPVNIDEPHEEKKCEPTQLII